MSLRVLTSIRLPVIQGELQRLGSCVPFPLTRVIGILMIGLKKLAVDRNPWVRKTVALGLPKVYE
jgi:AP-3 complex subunit beta